MTAAAVSALFAGLAFVAAVVFGVLNLRQGRSRPAWELRSRDDGNTWVLTNTGDAPAFDVRVEFPGVRPVAVDPDPDEPLGRVDAGQQVLWMLLYSEEMDRSRSTMRVRFRRRARGRECDPWTTTIV